MIFFHYDCFYDHQDRVKYNSDTTGYCDVCPCGGILCLYNIFTDLTPYTDDTAFGVLTFNAVNM